MGKMTAEERAKIDAQIRAENAARKKAAAQANARIRASNAKHSTNYVKSKSKPKPTPFRGKAIMSTLSKKKPVSKRGIVNRGKANILNAYKRSGDYEGT